MPTFVDELPKTNRGRQRKYDYDGLYAELLKNGKAVQLVKGEDFTCTGPSMRQFLYRDTKEKGLKARVRNIEDADGRDIVIFSVEKAPPEKAKTNGQGEKPKAEGSGETQSK